MSRRCPHRSHPCHRRIPESIDRLKKLLVLPVNLKLVTVLKHLKSMVAHRLSHFSYIISFFLLANSTCWPLMIFFTSQLNMLAFYDIFLLANSTCWPFMIFFYWPTQRIGLLYCSQMDFIGFCHSPSHMLGKYFLRCWPLTATGNLTPSNSSSM